MSHSTPSPPPAGDPDWVARAVAAVLAFKPNPARCNLLQLLSWWSHVDKLTTDQVEQVVDQVRTHLGARPTPDQPHWKPPRFRAEQAELYRRDAEGGKSRMNLHLLAHDPETGKVQVYRMELRAVIERDGVIDDMGRHQVHTRRSDDYDFTDLSVGAALTQILGLDPLTEGGGPS